MQNVKVLWLKNGVDKGLEGIWGYMLEAACISFNNTAQMLPVSGRTRSARSATAPRSIASWNTAECRNYKQYQQPKRREVWTVQDRETLEVQEVSKVSNPNVLHSSKGSIHIIVPRNTASMGSIRSTEAKYCEYSGSLGASVQH